MIETLLKYFNPQYLIGIGALISILGSILANRQSEIDYKKTDNKVDYISQVSTDTHKQVTGGDSYCSLIVSFDGTTNKPKFYINHIGDTKLDKVHVVIWDSGKIKKLRELGDEDGLAFIEEYKKCSTTKDVDVLYPNTMYSDIPINIDKDLTDIDLTIEIRFGNRELRQTILVSNYKNSNRIVYSKMEENGSIISESKISPKLEVIK